MKKLLTVAFALAIAVPAMSAEGGKKFSIGVYGGYTMVNPTDINQMLSDYKDILTALGKDSTLTKFSGGMSAGIEGDYAVTDNLGLGVRIGVVLITDATLKVNHGNDGVITLSTRGIPIEFGGRYMAPVSDNLSLGGGVFVGYAPVTLQSKAELNGSNPPIVKFDGSGLSLEVMASGAYKLAPEWSLGLDVGYRLLSNPLTYAEDDATTGVKKGDPVKHNNDYKDKMDLSGLIAALKISYLF